jgi:hypothetical protein
MPGTTASPTYPVAIVTCATDYVELDHLTQQQVASPTAAKRLARNLGYHVIPFGSLSGALDTSGAFSDTHRTVWTVMVSPSHP